jgi:hypothetical protein
MKTRLLMMVGMAFGMLYLALDPPAVRADSCGDDYAACRMACESNPNCGTYRDCFCAYESCTGQDGCGVA